MSYYIPGLGAHNSTYDKRTIQHNDLASFATAPSLTGGVDYTPEDIQHQHKVGICTAISLTQNAGKANGKKYSADFQYLLQKKFIDNNWQEGSSIFSALKVGKTFGFLPLELWTITTEKDRLLPYNEYIVKLQAVPLPVMQDLLARCVDKLEGYAQVDVSDISNIAKAIDSSKAGVLCRFDAGDTWYTAPDGHISWLTADINPLRKPVNDLSGHAITMSRYDLNSLDMVLANTWGVDWDRQGLADTTFNLYAPTEAWIPYYGLTDAQRAELQQKLQDAQLSVIDKLKQYIVLLKNKLSQGSR